MYTTQPGTICTPSNQQHSLPFVEVDAVQAAKTALPVYKDMGSISFTQMKAYLFLFSGLKVINRD